MACKDFEELILRDLDGEIANPDRVKLRDHMNSCQTCAKDRVHYANIDEAIKKIGTPAPPRRDFASIALEKAEASVAAAPRVVRKRVSGAVWATLGIAAVLVVMGTIGGFVYLSVQPVDVPPSANATPQGDKDKEDKEKKVEQAPVRYQPEIKRETPAPELTPEELRKVYPFGQQDPVAVLTDVNLGLISTESPGLRLDILEKGAGALLDGYAEALAYHDSASARQYQDGIAALLGQGMIPTLDNFRDASKAVALTALANTYRDRANMLMQLSRELPIDLRYDVQSVVGLCNKVRDSARAAARKQ